MPLYRNFRGICEMYGDCNDADPIPNFLSLCGMLSDSDEPPPDPPPGFNGVREMALELCEENNAPFFTEIVLPDNLRVKPDNDAVFTLTYAQLLAASDATDEEGDVISFFVHSVEEAESVEIDGDDLAEDNSTIGPGQVLAFTLSSDPGPRTALLLWAVDDQGNMSNVDVQLNVDVAMYVTGAATTLTGVDSVTFNDGEEDEENQAYPADPLIFGPYDNNEWPVESVNLYDSESVLIETVELSPTGTLPYSTYLFVHLEVAG